jgi:hypothetical protein
MNYSGLNPEFKIISNEYIPSEDAQNLENCTILDYREKGWKVLNKAKAGGLGFCKRKWTENTLYNILPNYTDYNDFKKNNLRAYRAAIKYKWINLVKDYYSK